MGRLDIPKTTLSVSPVCLGTGSFGTGLPEQDAFRLLDAFVDLGGNFLDTALVYANWIPGERSVSEKTIGKWLKTRGHRAEIVVATKGAHPELETMDVPRLSPAEIVADVDASLRHLQLERIDVYYLHRDDRKRPVGEIMETLQRQVQAGKLRYVACSNWRRDRIAAAQDYAAAHGFTGFVADSMLWNLAVVDAASLRATNMIAMDPGLHELHAEMQMAAVPYSSQAGGLFQKMAAGALDRDSKRFRQQYPMEENAQRFARVQHLTEVTGLTVSQVVLGYLLSQPFVTVPIVGCKTLSHLRDTMVAADVRLDPAQVAYLEKGEG